MKTLEYFKMASQTLLSKKLRSSLTMLGIIIGNASVITLMGIGEAAQNVAKEELNSLGPNVVFVLSDYSKVRKKNPRPLVLEDAKAIASEVPSVEQIAPQIRSTRIIAYNDENLSTQIIGTSPEFLEVRKFEVEKGRFLSDLDIKRNDQVVVLGYDIKNQLFGKENSLNQYIRINDVIFRVIGEMKSKGSYLGSNENDTVWIPITTMANKIVGEKSPYGIPLTALALSIKNAQDINTANFHITNLLRLRHQITTEDDFRIESQRDLLKTADKITTAITILLVAIASISLIVGGIGIMNIMLVSVSERTPEIGLRKAIGASPNDILIQFLIEAIILSITGGIIGMMVGIGGNFLISIVSPLTVGISPVAISLSLGVSGSIGLFFGVFPAKEAAKLDPIVALRSN